MIPARRTTKQTTAAVAYQKIELIFNSKPITTRPEASSEGIA